MTNVANSHDSDSADQAFHLLSPFSWMRGLRNILWGEPAPPPTLVRPLPGYVRYRARRRSLPMDYSLDDWSRALTYWQDTCAICERPRGLWHTISQDHWVPLSDAHCPGTVATNMLPLCYGADGCNNSKGGKNPEKWLVQKLGKRKAKRKLEEIHQYFAWIAELKGETADLLSCPDCGYPLGFEPTHEVWHCNACNADWREKADET